MPLPSRERCLAIMDEQAMPANIRAHSVLVADLSMTLARDLAAAGLELELDLVESSALLHDIGKARSLETGEDHSVLGAEMVEQLGYPRLAPIVRHHALLRLRQLDDDLDESMLVNYSDKRVMHDGLVGLRERLEDLAERYARTPEERQLLFVFLPRYEKLEERIFALLPYGPDEVGSRL